MIEEPYGLLAGKPTKIVPHVPIYKRDGNVVVLYRESPFIDRMGNEATITSVEYKDKKGKLHELVIKVEWDQ